MADSYIGIKRVEAYPEERNGQDGYVVIYPDGYKSWSPKDVFESAYFKCTNKYDVSQEDIENFINCSKVHKEGKFLFITYPTGYKDFDLASLDENPSQEDFCKSMDAIKNRLTKFLLFVNMWANNGLNKSNLEEKVKHINILMLTGKDDEWIKVKNINGIPLFENKLYPSVFKYGKNGQAYDDTSFPRRDVDFPYFIKHCNVKETT